MKNLTEKQKMYLDYIEEYQNLHGYAPTFEEIGKKFNVTRQSAFYCINWIVKKGYIKKPDREVRFFILTYKNQKFINDKNEFLFQRTKKLVNQSLTALSEIAGQLKEVEGDKITEVEEDKMTEVIILLKKQLAFHCETIAKLSEERNNLVVFLKKQLAFYCETSEKLSKELNI